MRSAVVIAAEDNNSGSMSPKFRMIAAWETTLLAGAKGAIAFRTELSIFETMDMEPHTRVFSVDHISGSKNNATGHKIRSGVFGEKVELSRRRGVRHSPDMPLGQAEPAGYFGTRKPLGFQLGNGGLGVTRRPAMWH